MTDRELRLKLDKARWFALQEQPFYGSLAMGLTDSLTDDIPTACTNGRGVKWGRKFLEGLTAEETRFVLLHEALHCAHGHLWRLPPTMRGNEAGDYAINLVLQDIPGISMPKGGLLDRGFIGMAEEEILARLPDPPKGKSGKQGSENGSPTGDFEEPAEEAKKPDKPGDEPGEGAGEGPTLQEEWERRVIQAQQAAQAMGKGDMPADLQRVLDRIRHQPIDWRQETADFLKNVISTRNDWSRSARRHAHAPVIYPRKRADDIGLVVLHRDTSGSITDEQAAVFSAYISQAIAEVGCRALVIDGDTCIHAEYWLEPGEECPLRAIGGGGTNHTHLFERVAELAEAGEKIAGIVALTDLVSSFPADDGGHATLWLSTTDRTAPFGRTVKLES